jgi:hypothetical protein
MQRQLALANAKGQWLLRIKIVQPRGKNFNHRLGLPMAFLGFRMGEIEQAIHVLA